MKVALIGYGYWGKILYKYLVKDERFNVIYIYDKNFEQVNDIFTNSLDVIFNDSLVDAVIIATPSNTHKYFILKALESGKHVFCEKPLVTDLADFKEVEGALINRPQILYTDYIYLTSASMKAMKLLISNFGKVKFIRMSINQCGKIYKGENVFDTIGIHMLSVLLYVLEISNLEDVYINVNSFVKKEGKILAGELLLKYQESLSRISCSLVSPTKERVIEVFCTGGYIKYDMYHEDTIVYSKYNDPESSGELNFIKLSFNEDDNIKFALDAFFDSVISKRSNFDISRLISNILENIKSIENVDDNNY